MLFGCPSPPHRHSTLHPSCRLDEWSMLAESKLISTGLSTGTDLCGHNVSATMMHDLFVTHVRL